MTMHEVHEPSAAPTVPPPAAGYGPGPESGHVAHTVEPTRLTYLIRRSVLGGSFLAVVVAALVVTGSLSLPGAGDADSGAALTGVTGQPEQPAGEQPTAQPDPVPPTAEGAVGGVQPEPEVPVAKEPVPVAPVEPAAPGLPPRASRLVPQAPQRVLDTRDGGSAAPGTSHSIPVEPGRTAVALSVTIAGTTQSGAVIADGGAGQVTIAEVGGPGAGVTNLVVIPVVNGQVSLWSTAGGYLVVDVVGSFEESGETAAGRFVPTDATQVARLETAVDGRETQLALQDALPADADAALILISADVGSNGGTVRFGPAPGQWDQALMWGPASAGNLQRRGLVLVNPSELDAAHLRYDGGTLLTAQVVGYFTDDNAESATAGLYVPSGPRVLYDGPARSGGPVTVEGVSPENGIALVTTAAPAGPGEVGLSIAPVSGGSLTVTEGLPVTDGPRAVVTLLGVFLG